MKELKQVFEAKTPTFYFDNKNVFSCIKKKHIRFLCKYAKKSQKSVRVCLHNDINDTLHNMIIVHLKGTYIRPHKNVSNSKAYHIIKGRMRIIGILDDGSKVFDMILDKEQPLLRIEPNIYLLLLPLTKMVVFHEVAIGPFRQSGPGSQVYAHFSPSGDNKYEIRYFIQKYKMGI